LQRRIIVAKAKLNPILQEVRGKVGDLVFRKTDSGLLLTRKADLDGHTPTEAQAMAQERFRQATVYGKTVMADPETKALYDTEAQNRGVPVFSLTVADFFHAPSVDEIDLSGYAGKAGETIGIRAHDDFAVVGVAVEIARADGQAVEAGDAVETPPNSGHWVYTATHTVPTGTAVRVNVTAKDHPGHAGTKTANK
jgi:hypothetical protein